MIEICKIRWGADSKKASKRFVRNIFCCKSWMSCWFFTRCGSKSSIAKQFWKFLSETKNLLVKYLSNFLIQIDKRQTQPNQFRKIGCRNLLLFLKPVYLKQNATHLNVCNNGSSSSESIRSSFQRKHPSWLSPKPNDDEDDDLVKQFGKLINKIRSRANHGAKIMTNVNVAQPKSPLWRKSNPVIKSETMSLATSRDEKTTLIANSIKCFFLWLTGRPHQNVKSEKEVFKNTITECSSTGLHGYEKQRI